MSGKDQLELIDVHGEEVKALIEPARAYKKTIYKRLKIQEKEAEQKSELIGLVKQAKLKPITENGKKVVRFKYEGVTIEYTHEDKDNIKVKEEDE